MFSEFCIFFLFITNNKKTVHPIHIKCSFTRRNCTRFSHPSPITHSLHSVQSRARATTAFFLPANCKKQESTLFNKKTVQKLQHTPEFSYLQKCLYIIWRFWENKENTDIFKFVPNNNQGIINGFSNNAHQVSLPLDRSSISNTFTGHFWTSSSARSSHKSSRRTTWE